MALTVWLAPAGADVRARGRALLAYAAGVALGMPPGAVQVTREPGGRPLLCGAGAGLHVGVSHTRGVVAVVTSRLAPVGVDVEAVRALPAGDLARRWMTPAEATWVDGHPADRRARAFLLLWTYKEAVGKARGTGLRGGGLRQPAPLTWPAGDEVVLRPVPGDAGMAAGAAPARAGLVLAVACAAGGAAGLRPTVRLVG